MLRVAKAGVGTPPSSIGLVESLRERIRLLEAVVDNFPGGISLFDKDLRMVLCNEQQKKLLDYPQYLFASGNPTLASQRDGSRDPRRPTAGWRAHHHVSGRNRAATHASARCAHGAPRPADKSAGDGPKQSF